MLLEVELIVKGITVSILPGAPSTICSAAPKRTLLAQVAATEAAGPAGGRNGAATGAGGG